MHVPTLNLLPAETLALRDALRAARYAALADAEGFTQVCFAVEALGMRLLQKEGVLSDYLPQIKALANHTPIFSQLPNEFPALFTRFEALYETVRRARNDVMHTGSYARHASTAAVELSIGLEDALMNASSAKLTVADYMVKTPISLESWHPVAHARQLMLMHSFSFLPVFHDNQWRLLSELAVVAYLHGQNRSQKEIRLAKSISNAANDGLKLLAATTVKHSDHVSQLISSSSVHPTPTLWLVTTDGDRLEGVLSPFELM